MRAPVRTPISFETLLLYQCRQNNSLQNSKMTIEEGIVGDLLLFILSDLSAGSSRIGVDTTYLSKLY